MTRTKLGLLGLCAVALSLMVFSAAGAQAEKGARWLILTSGGVLKEGSTLNAPLNVRKDIFNSPFVLHSEILKIKVLFLCESISIANAKLLAEGSIGQAPGFVSGSTITFSFCTTDLNGVFASECTPVGSTITTNPGHALLVLGAAGERLVKVLPDIGETLATITLPAACPIGTKVPLIGKINLKDCENLMSTHLFEHLVEQGPGTELFTISKTAEHAATLLGSAWVALFGEDINLKWSGDPA
jgi:hypothetical protein